jgi:hypothetical protein
MCGVILLATWIAGIVTRRDKRRLQDELAQRSQQVEELATRLVQVSEASLAARGGETPATADAPGDPCRR